MKVTVVSLVVVFLTALFCQTVPISNPPVPATAPINPNSWSKPTNGLQLRITLVEKPKINGTRSIVPYLELRNVDDSATPLKVRCDDEHVKFALIGANG